MKRIRRSLRSPVPPGTPDLVFVENKLNRIHAALVGLR